VTENGGRVLLARWDVPDRSEFSADTPEEREARAQWVYNFFGGADRTPAFIWRVEFWSDNLSNFMTVHRFAKDDAGSRYLTWVKVSDVKDHAQTVRVPAAVAPEEHVVAELPPAELLR
jgi:hypothetical protein